MVSKVGSFRVGSKSVFVCPSRFFTNKSPFGPCNHPGPNTNRETFPLELKRSMCSWSFRLHKSKGKNVRFSAFVWMSYEFGLFLNGLREDSRVKTVATSATHTHSLRGGLHAHPSWLQETEDSECQWFVLKPPDPLCLVSLAEETSTTRALVSVEATAASGD